MIAQKTTPVKGNFRKDLELQKSLVLAMEEIL
jgi:hypothetical protein